MWISTASTPPSLYTSPDPELVVNTALMASSRNNYINYMTSKQY
jgi:hypothetical protein